MQFTLTDNAILEVSTLSGDDAVELRLQATATDGSLLHERFLVSGISTERLRHIAQALIFFAEVVECAARAERAERA